MIKFSISTRPNCGNCDKPALTNEIIKHNTICNNCGFTNVLNSDGSKVIKIEKYIK